MDMFPEMFAGATGLTALQFATGTCDQTPAANSGVELFNPAIVGSGASMIDSRLLTLVGLVIWGAQAGAVNVDVWDTTNNALVATAADIGPRYFDKRRTDAPVGTLKKGNLASVAAGFDPNTTQLARFVLAAAQVIPFKLPWNQDIQPGTGILITVSGTTRTVVTPIWVEHVQTS